MNSNKIKAFNPFVSRVCRTARNALGQSLLAAIPAGELEPVTKVAQTVAPVEAADVIRSYVAERLARYRVVFADLRSTGMQTGRTWFIARLLWDQGLFFECHEWLEEKWRRSEGAERKMVQALIWATGAYAQLEYGRAAEAGKLAARAVDGLKCYRERVPELFDVDALVQKLEILDPVPPKFGSGQKA